MIPVVVASRDCISANGAVRTGFLIFVGTGMSVIILAHAILIGPVMAQCGSGFLGHNNATTHGALLHLSAGLVTGRFARPELCQRAFVLADSAALTAGVVRMVPVVLAIGIANSALAVFPSMFASCVADILLKVFAAVPANIYISPSLSAFMEALSAAHGADAIFPGVLTRLFRMRMTMHSGHGHHGHDHHQNHD